MGRIDYGTVTEIIKRAGAVLKKSCGSQMEYIEKGNFDFVTVMDMEIQEYLIREMIRAGGELNFICEEKRNNDYSYDDVWLIDPIDGTTNFIHGYPNFCIAAAHVMEGEVIFSIIYNPISGELFTAEKGKGAYLNGERIHVSIVSELKDAILIVGFPYDREKGELVFDMMKALHKKCSDIKRRGSASLDFADVACGRAEAYFELDLKPWDIAPGYLLVSEAGGRVTCSADLFGGKDRFHAYAKNSVIEVPEFGAML